MMCRQWNENGNKSITQEKAVLLSWVIIELKLLEIFFITNRSGNDTNNKPIVV